MDDEAELFRLALEASPSGMLMLDAHGCIVLVNREIERLFGYDRAELLGKPVEILIPDRFRAGHVARRAQFAEQPSTRWMGHGRDLFGLRKDGSEVALEIGLNPVETKRGKLVLSAITDITARKRAEREREGLLNRLAREERFKAAFENSPIAMAILDDRLTYVYVNQAFTRILGYTPEELAGKTPADITHPEDRAGDDTLLTALLRDELQAYTREKRYLRNDGAIIHVALHAAVVRDPSGDKFFIGQIQDITARVEAESEVRTLQSELAREAEIKDTILKNMPRGAVFLIDRALRYVSAYGPSVPDLLRCSADELPGRSAEHVIPAPYRQEMLTHVRATLDGKEVVFETVRGTHTYEVRTAPIYSGESIPVAALIHLYDISERKAQEHALAAERERFRAVVTNAPVGIFEMDLHGNVLFMNEHWCKLTGLDPEEARSPSSRIAGVHPDDRDKVMNAWSSAWSEGDSYKTDFRYRRPDGKVRRLSSVAAPMRGPDGRALSMIGFTVDATAQLDAAEATHRSLREKETLLREVHHRVKNNLQVIVSLIGLTASRSRDQRIHTVMDDLRSRIRAIAVLHERLYGSPDLGAIDLAAYLRGLAIDCAHAAGVAPDRVRVHAPDAPIDLVLDDAVPVGLVVNELITNAVKHGAAGGDSVRVEVEVTLERDAVHVTVADSGPGFPEGFSAQDGKTLGMLLVRNLTHQLRGEIAFASRPTRVTLTFPFRGAGGALTPPAA